MGNPSEFTMLELADQVLAKVGGSSQLVFEPLPGDDPKQRKPDITLAKKHLDWEPQVSLTDGLDRAIAYFRSVV
jgi:UDP-glucuronate decarboxylase